MGLRPLRRAPERRPSISEAGGGLRSPPQAAPQVKVLRFPRSGKATLSNVAKRMPGLVGGAAMGALLGYRIA